MYWNLVGSVTFYSPRYDLEVIEKENDYFVLKQTKEIPSQDAAVTTESTYEIYHVKFVKENDEWKFAGAELQK